MVEVVVVISSALGGTAWWPARRHPRQIMLQHRLAGECGTLRPEGFMLTSLAVFVRRRAPSPHNPPQFLDRNPSDGGNGFVSASLLQPRQHASHITDRLGQTRQWVGGVLFVLEGDNAVVVDLL